MKWVYCPNGKGYREADLPTRRLRHFKENSVGIVCHDNEVEAVVWLIGTDEKWIVKSDELLLVEVLKTGDQFDHKICNLCHCLLPVTAFAKNQNNIHGVVRRPTCTGCRTDIDKRPPKSQQAKQAEKNRPKKGTPFQCPICRKRSIVGVTAKIVADHNHHTGDIRDFICDSCNTGLGRFKNGKDCLKDALAYIEERE